MSPVVLGCWSGVLGGGEAGLEAGFGVMRLRCRGRRCG